MSQTRPSHRYPPLISFALVIFLVVAVLPSALNLPQSNPSTTLEYAPVPPTDEDSAPPAGNVASLNLAASARVTDDVAGPPPAAPAIGKNPRTKRCVGQPPRQTEDPISPPCVAFFEGDNFGATYRGVSRSEVRVLFYFDKTGGNTSGRGFETAPPAGTYYDLAQPADPNEYFTVRDLRNFQRYFNNRYQTYDRFVHFFVHFGREDKSPESRKADVADAFRRVKPFAAVSFADANGDAYVDEWTRRGVVTLIGTWTGESSIGAPASFYRRYPGLAWSYIPSLEQRARLFETYVCSKVVPHRVSFSGDASRNGTKRVLGIVRIENPDNFPQTHFGRVIKRGVSRCGGRPTDGVIDGTASAPAVTAQFIQAGVTTALLATGDLTVSRAFAASGYRPEILVAGDDVSERPLQSRLQEQSVWANARATTIYVRADSIDQMPCAQAYREVDDVEQDTQVRSSGCDIYASVRQLFTGVQVAGPRLTPRNIDRGFHAIPPIASTSPYTQACFYETNDYSCVKDAQAQWWDPSGDNPGSSQPGCWRMMQGGKRYLAGTWPAGDVEKQRSASDRCTVQGADLA